MQAETEEMKTWIIQLKGWGVGGGDLYVYQIYFPAILMTSDVRSVSVFETPSISTE